MTVASFQDPAMSLASTTSEPLFSLLSGEQFNISPVSGSMSFDWSDFPVVYQYNEDTSNMPVPSVAPTSTSSMRYYSSPQAASCSRSPMSVVPIMPWEVEDDDDATSLSVSSVSVSSDEEETVVVKSNKEVKKSHQKSVSFSSFLEIRSHALVLGDHPCCASLALELGWEHQEAEVVDFDVYEKRRRYQRRHLHALRLSYWDRRWLLEQSTGLSEQELLCQEQFAWRELDTEIASRDKAPTLPYKSSCSHEAQQDKEQHTFLRKVSSMKTLPSLAS